MKNISKVCIHTDTEATGMKKNKIVLACEVTGT